MPTIRLNDRSLAGLKPTAEKQTDYFDHALPGFGVRVSPTGKKTFQLLYRVNGRFRRLTLRDPQTNVSTYPTLTLADARALAQAALRISTVGRDPAAEQKQARERSFGALCDLYIEKHAKRKKRSWRADARMIRQELKGWRDTPVTALRRRDVIEVLDGIVGRPAPILANRVLSLISKILNFGLSQDWIDANVAAKMPKPAAEQSRSRVLTDDEIRAVWKHFERTASGDTDPRLWALTTAALKLRLVTAQRGKEVLAMRWQDIDGVWWTIPADTAKNKQAHRVPLAPTARAILTAVKASAAEKDSKANGYVFEGIRGPRHRRGALSGLKVEDVRPHDFRRTAASMMAAGGVPRLTIAKILNHADGSVTAIYDRHSYDSEKLAALAWWGTKLAAIVEGKRAGKVLPFGKTA